MALTDEEQRLLDLLESSLRSDDPKLAAQFSSAKLTDSRPAPPTIGHLVAAGVVCLVGVGMLVVGMMVVWPISVAGFLVMLGAVAFAFVRPKPADMRARGRSGQTTPERPSRGVKERMEQRWESRQGKERA